MQETITKQVAKYGHSAHIILSKKLIGQTVTVSKGRSDTKKLLTAINSLQARLTHLEDRTAGNHGSITEVLGKNKNGDLIFGKTRPMKNAPIKSQ